MKAANVDDVYNLSPMQRGVLFHTLYAPSAGVYFHQAAFELQGELDPAAFEGAWQRVIERHPVLRTSFQWEDMDKPVQIVHHQVAVPLEKLDWSDVPADEQEKRLQAYLQADRERGVKLDQAPLMRLALIRTAPDAHFCVWSHHHLILDGWSVPLVLKEVITCYEAQRRGVKAPLPPTRPYRDYIAWLRQQDLAKAEAFWRQNLQGFAFPTRLSTSKTPTTRASHAARYQEHQADLSEELTAALQALARQHQVTLNTLMLGAWSLLLSRYSGQDDVVFGATVSGRPPELKGFESMVGLFINTLPVRVRVPDEERLLPWLKQLQAQQAELRQYEYTPLVEVQGWSEVPRVMPLFETLYVFENYPVDATFRKQGGQLGVRELFQRGRSSYPLTLIVIPKKRHVTVRITYERGRFDGDTVARLAGHLQTVLQGMVANPDQPLASLPLLTEAEQRQCVGDWSGATASYPKEKCLHDWFASQVERAPDAVAVVCQGERLTYQELNRRANQLAHYLRSLGVGPEVLVGVYLERSLDLVVALLATLKAGGAYVPLDPVYPRERLSLILTDARAPVLLTQQSLVQQLPEHPGRTVCLETEAAAIAACPADNPAAGTTPDNLAYVIYTSGSTGQPKGAQVSHYNVVRLFQATQDWYHFDDKDVWTLFHSFAFDFSVWEIWGALLYGGRLVVVPYRTSRAPDEFYDLLRAEGVTVLNQTPSAFRQLISLEETRGQAADDLALRLVIFGGEALEIKSLGPWFDRHGDQKPQLVNMYGITETTVHVTYRPLTAADLTSAPGSMIGRPIPDLALYVLDKDRRLLPVGVPGELYVGGAGVARGYLNRPELTAERFIDDPFRPGGRLYKSGDLARWLPDGDLEYLGRDDDQVKIRGFRIELGEIENALLHAPGVREAVVMARPQNEDPANKRAASNLYDPLGQLRKTLVQVIDKRLVAYVVPQADAMVTAGTLRDFLKARLPDYMVPAAFVILDRLPLTANGKVDRKSLPAPGRSRADLNNPYQPPQTELEKLLADLWQDILKVDKVGLNDNFFEIGGNSVLGITLITRLQQRLGEIVQVVTLFDAPTVADLAAHLRKHYATAVARVCPNEPLQDAAALAGGAEDSRVEPADLAHVREILQEHAAPLAASEPAGEGNGMPKNRPAVFVLSPPRSGTTLLRVILGGHPRLFAPPELELLSFATLRQRKTVFSGRDSFWLEGALRAIMEIKGCDADEAKRLMAECEDQDWTTRRLYHQLQEWLGDRLLVDKTPSYALRPESIRRMEDEFDRPYYLHLLRHPQAVIRSFEEAKLDQLFFRYPHPFPTRKLAELIWTLSHQNIQEFLAQVPAERRLEVRFEDLVARPDAVVGEMCRFLGLDLEPAMLRPYEDKKGRMTDGIHPESRMLGDVKFHDYRGIEAKAADRWRDTQAEDLLGEVTWQTAEALGYERTEAGANGQAVNGQAAKLPSVLAPLRSGGSRQPFFCVHPLGGSVFPFGMLAYHMGKDQPFYGLQAQGMYGTEKPHTNLELMAADYIRAMRAVQPEGPYLVGGWSLGAVVAFEIAQQLHRDGQQTALLAILDAPVFPSLFLPMNERTFKPEHVDDEHSLARLTNSLGISVTHLLQMKRDEQWALVAEQVKRANLVPPDINLKQFIRWVGVARANYRALMGYTVRPYPGPITVFRAGENDLRKLADTSPSLGWDKLSERIDIQPLPGDHRSILREPSVRVLAERLNACIDKALADHGVLSPR